MKTPAAILAVLLATAAAPALAEGPPEAAASVQAGPAPGALGAETPPPPASASHEDVARWRAAYISEGHSALLGATPEAVEYAVGGTLELRPQDRMRAWMRWEAFRPLKSSEGDVRSYTELVEVDCADQRARLLAMDTFPFNNLQGASRHHDAQDPHWAYPRPNSALEGEVKALCGVRDLAMLQLAAAAAAQSGAAPAEGGSTLALAAAQPR